MWGGWYDDPSLMKEIGDMKKIYERKWESGRSLSREVVFFADERGYSLLFSASPQLSGIADTRKAMGNTGVPYDIYMVEDAERVLRNYKAAVFPMPISSDAGKKAMELCEKMGIPYIAATVDNYHITVEKLTKFYKNNGIHSYTDENDVVYVGNGYVGLHSASSGKKRLILPDRYTVSPVFGTDFSEKTTDMIEFNLKENATALFSVSK